MVKCIGPSSIDGAGFGNERVFIACIVITDTTGQRFGGRAGFVNENIIDTTTTDTQNL